MHQHMEQVKRIWRYLKGTEDLGITLGSKNSIDDLKLWLHCDASWADDPVTCKTTAGHIIFLGNSPIHWQLKQQDLVTLSMTEAEFINFSTAGHDLIWIRQLLRETGLNLTKIPSIGTDSTNLMKVAKRNQHSLSTRHTDIRYKWIKEKCEKGELTLEWVLTDNMRADSLMKPFGTTQQAHFVQLLEMTKVIS